MSCLPPDFTPYFSPFFRSLPPPVRNDNRRACGRRNLFGCSDLAGCLGGGGKGGGVIRIGAYGSLAPLTHPPPLPCHRTSRRDRIQYLQNLSIAIDFITNRGIRLENISAEDVADGKRLGRINKVGDAVRCMRAHTHTPLTPPLCPTFTRRGRVAQATRS